MTKQAHRIDVFDPAYRDRICDAVWKAIVEASRDPATGISSLRNYEVYDALLQIQAMILASSRESNSPAKLREITDDFSKRLRRLIADFRKTYASEGAPFDVVHTDEMQ